MSHSVFNQSFDVWQYCNILCHYSFFSSVCVWWGDINNTATPGFWPQKWTLPIMKTFPCQKTLQCCIYTQHVQCNFSLILVQTIYWIAKDFCQVQYFHWESSLFLIAHIPTAIIMENQELRLLNHSVPASWCRSYSKYSPGGHYKTFLRFSRLSLQQTVVCLVPAARRRGHRIMRTINR